ncbi:MAG: gamma carbonic anhydrase family protein [Euryarchaeota archaeon]|nr:gamma carbonic anhydrase family protein [Euryarchaeota archaeon]
MAAYEFEGKRPKAGSGSYIHDTADLIGDVTLGENCYVGPGARVRGDYGTIIVGRGTAIEDNCVLHARPGERLEIGKSVTVGHGAIVHNCTVRDFAVIGMGAVVSDYSVVGEWAVVGEGAVVKNKQEIPAKAIAVGVPAKVVGEIDDDFRTQWTKFKGMYEELARRRYPGSLKKTG